jgi:hypothetical protein
MPRLRASCDKQPMKQSSSRCALAAALIVPVLIGCSPDGSPRRGPVVAENPAEASEAVRPAQREPVEFSGTIHHLPVEGGVYVIRTENGTQYRPNELPEEYRVEGLAVDVKALKHDDVLTRDMAGQTVDLVEIRRR